MFPALLLHESQTSQDSELHKIIIDRNFCTDVLLREKICDELFIHEEDHWFVDHIREVDVVGVAQHIHSSISVVSMRFLILIKLVIERGSMHLIGFFVNFVS